MSPGTRSRQRRERPSTHAAGLQRVNSCPRRPPVSARRVIVVAIVVNLFFRSISVVVTGSGGAYLPPGWDHPAGVPWLQRRRWWVGDSSGGPSNSRWDAVVDRE